MKPEIEYRPKPRHSKPIAAVKKRKAKKAAKMGRPPTGFNKTEYMRLYMLDRTPAKKLGLTVKQYRSKSKGNTDNG